MKKALSIIDTEKGASSILVVLLMVVLMVFGMAVLTTTLSNKRLSDNKKIWLYDYYKLEGAAEERIAYFDALLIKANDDAKDFIENDDYTNEYNINVEVDTSEIPQSVIKERLFALYYMDRVNELINESIQNDDNAFLYSSEVNASDVLNGEVLESYRLEFTSSIESSNYPKYITVTLELVPPNIDNLSLDYRLETRYNTIEYIEWQDPFEIEDIFEFEDPF